MLEYLWKEQNSAAYIDKKLYDKINELVVEYNHLAKDFELYKKAYTGHLIDEHTEYE